MRVIFQARKTDSNCSETELTLTAIHEAAHAVVGEILRPGSVSVVSIYSMGENAAGITAGIASANYSDENIFHSAMIGLAGKAGVDVILGRFDVGVGDDLQKVHQLLSSWATRYAGNGFGSLESSDRSTSEQSMREHELLIAAKMDELYQKARKLVFEHKDSICALSKVLTREHALLSNDIAKIIGC